MKRMIRASIDKHVDYLYLTDEEKDKIAACPVSYKEFCRDNGMIDDRYSAQEYTAFALGMRLHDYLTMLSSRKSTV